MEPLGEESTNFAPSHMQKTVDSIASMRTPASCSRGADLIEPQLLLRSVEEWPAGEIVSYLR